VRGQTDPQVLVGGTIPITISGREGQIRESWTVGGRVAVNFSLPF
jgi:hypothetical protein